MTDEGSAPRFLFSFNMRHCLKDCLPKDSHEVRAKEEIDNRLHAKNHVQMTAEITRERANKSHAKEYTNQIRKTTHMQKSTEMTFVLWDVLDSI
jgi:hypothetical protein